MKVISGILKNKNFSRSVDPNIRPTLSRIREDILNVLIHNPSIKIDIKDIILLDAFAGTGSIGIEALSRGAKWVTFNDISVQSTKKISSFLNDNKIKNFSTCNYDLLKFFDNNLIQKHNCVFLDPPYKYDLDIILEKINALNIKHFIIITESYSDIKFNQLNIFSKIYKDKHINFYLISN